VLGCIGLVFLAAAFWPLGGATKAYLRTALFGLVGAGAVAVSVWLWLVLMRTAGQIAVQTPPPPGGTTSISTAQRAPSSSPAATSSPSASAASQPASPSVSPTVVLTPIPAVAFQPDNGPTQVITVAVEPFEHGVMLYRSDLKQLYVLTDDKRFKVYPDTWDDTQPDLGTLTPVAGKYLPRRGFGKLWNSNPDVKQGLGSATAPEQGLSGTVTGDGTTTTIRADLTYALAKDGTWTLK